MTRYLRARNESGFTLIELLVVLLLVSVMATFGALAFRHFARVQALEGSADAVITALRGLQQRVVAETHPLVYGARFKKNASEWQVIQYDPETEVCTRVGGGFGLEGGQFTGDVVVDAAKFDNYGPDAVLPANITAKCRAGFTDVLFFFARGSATGGYLTLEEPRLNRTKTVCITPVTARVEHEEDIDGGACYDPAGG